MTIYPDKLLYIAEERGLTTQQMASLGGISLDRYEKVLQGEYVPSITQIKRLAENTAVPYYAFFSKSFEIRDHPIVDFRGENPKKFKYGLISKAIHRNVLVQNFFAELYQRLELAAPDKITSIDPEANPEQFAQSLRFELGLDEFQFSSETKKVFFRELRRRVQKLGIFVVQDHNISDNIDGFSLFHKNFTSNYIFINSSKRNSGRKAFTLVHELCHILGKRSAISDDYDASNDVEKYCNLFAASLLLPRNILIGYVEKNELKFDDYKVAVYSATKIANHFNTSISAALVRVFQVGISSTNYYFEYGKTFGQGDHPDSVKQKQKGGPVDGPDQGIIAVAQYGERAAALIAQAVNNGVTSPEEICERVGLSNKRIKGMIERASSEGYSIE